VDPSLCYSPLMRQPPSASPNGLKALLGPQIFHYRPETSGEADHFDEHRQRRIANQSLFVPGALDGKEIMRSNNGRRLERNRKFVDSPLEGGGFEPSVPHLLGPFCTAI
jgi:hypothetical protein